MSGAGHGHLSKLCPTYLNLYSHATQAKMEMGLVNSGNSCPYRCKSEMGFSTNGNELVPLISLVSWSEESFATLSHFWGISLRWHGAGDVTPNFI